MAGSLPSERSPSFLLGLVGLLLAVKAGLLQVARLFRNFRLCISSICSPFLRIPSFVQLGERFLVGRSGLFRVDRRAASDALADLLQRVEGGPATGLGAGEPGLRRRSSAVSRGVREAAIALPRAMP